MVFKWVPSLNVGVGIRIPPERTCVVVKWPGTVYVRNTSRIKSRSFVAGWLLPPYYDQVLDRNIGFITGHRLLSYSII